MSIISLVRNKKGEKEMDNFRMNQKLGTKWFTFFTKVRPILTCIMFITTIADFVQYYDLYAQYWWLFTSFLFSVVDVILSIITFAKSFGNYVKFVDFIKGNLIFEVISISYQQGVQQYINSNFNFGIAALSFAIYILLFYFIWYRLNMKYFKKRIIQVMAENTETQPETFDEQIKYCRKCGQKLLDDATFCGMCGTEVIRQMKED